MRLIVSKVQYRQWTYVCMFVCMYVYCAAMPISCHGDVIAHLTMEYQ